MHKFHVLKNLNMLLSRLYGLRMSYITRPSKILTDSGLFTQYIQFKRFDIAHTEVQKH